MTEEAAENSVSSYGNLPNNNNKAADEVLSKEYHHHRRKGHRRGHRRSKKDNKDTSNEVGTDDQYEKTLPRGPWAAEELSKEYDHRRKGHRRGRRWSRKINQDTSNEVRTYDQFKKTLPRDPRASMKPIGGKLDRMQCVRIIKKRKTDLSNAVKDNEQDDILLRGPEPGAFWSGLRCLRKTPLTSFPSPHVEPDDPEFVKEFANELDVYHRASMKPIGGKWDRMPCVRIIKKRKTDLSAVKADDQDDILLRGPEPGAFWSGLRCLRKTPLTSYPTPHVEPDDPEFVKEFAHELDVLHRASMKPIGVKLDRRPCVRIIKKSKRDLSNALTANDQDEILPIGPEPGACWSGLRCLRKTPLTSYPSPHVEPDDPEFVKEFSHELDALRRASMKPIGGKWDRRPCVRIIKKSKSDLSNAVKANDQDEILSKDQDEILPRGSEPCDFWSGLSCLGKTPVTSFPNQHVEEDDPEFMKEDAHELDVLHQASMKPLRGKWDCQPCVRIVKLKSGMSNGVQADEDAALEVCEEDNDESIYLSHDDLEETDRIRRMTIRAT